MSNRSWKLVPVVVVAVLGTACSSGEDADLLVEAADPAEEPTVADGPVGDQDQPPERDAEVSEGTGGSPDEGPTAAWPDPIPVDAVGRHPGGLSVEVREVRAEASSIDLAVRVTNGQTNTAVRLTEMVTPSVLVDDLGNEYPIVAPEDDAFLEVEPAEVLEGTLSFVGPLDPDATSLTLIVNPEREVEEQDGETVVPYLAIEGIELVGGEGAVDDGANDADGAQDAADTDA
ncbi:hypothetical protein FTX61_19235 [Nitriliruptoraceae bacterium ZYF776]|nr:hypothetical protein [Profundirhabdus halotolerans]